MGTNHASRYPAPPRRRLMGYAFDPSLSLELETSGINEVRLEVPWEDLEPGPVGEYLEIVDFDPATGCFYPPVDLNDPFMLATDGLPPTDGDPQFHQQMVYAVSMLTIKAFEKALGRPSFWAPGPSTSDKDDSNYVQRLRVYPHALREANAFYSPPKVALLFGYFAADATAVDHLPGGSVFTCLSHDIVAHETTHALLDGMHRNYRKPTNPDTLAFHEAFADLVALFQHFTFPEIVRHQVARSRGDLRAETLLGQLAVQFGRATGGHGALRNAIGRVNRENKAWEPTPIDAAAMTTTLEPHRRGSILVAAVFDAFISIYEDRVEDLIRLATGGTGKLPDGAISTDLADRLSREAARAAGHVRTMCIRALDYCPPVDLTFGEFLRALLTADRDVCPVDQRNYRTAFVQAFRRRGIFPDGVRTMSLGSLLWTPPEASPPFRKPSLGKVLEKLRPFVQKSAYTTSRENLFILARTYRAMLHELLVKHFAGKAGRRDAEILRIRNPEKQSFEVHSLRIAERIGPDGEKLPQMIIEITQRVDKNTEDEFEGGCTLIVDLQRLEVRYCIFKDVDSRERRERQRSFQASFAGATLRSIYFPTPTGEAPDEPFRMLHRRTFEGADHA